MQSRGGEWRGPRRRRAPPRGAVGVVSLLAALSMAAAVVTVGAPRAGAIPSVTFTMTWSTPALPDTGGPIAESSPMEATLDGSGPAVVVGDRSGNVFAYHLSDGSAVAGWPAGDGGVPIDSTPSVSVLPDGLDEVYVGAGNAAQPGTGGYLAYSPQGSEAWATAVINPPGDAHPAGGVQASMTVADLQGRTAVVAGSLDSEEYALDTGSGDSLPGWPFFTSDSVFSTAAAADLYGTGQQEIVDGGDQTAGFALGQNYTAGGHLRILNDHGGLICHDDTNQTVDSSPAVGGFLANGATGIAVGTGSFFPGAGQSDDVMAFDTHCGPVWSDTLDGSTFSSPALADVAGNGVTDVVEGTDTGSGGSVWVLNGTNGATVWKTSVVGRVIGSVVTADLTGQGYQDVLVPTTAGVEVLDGLSGSEVTVLSSDLGFQNSPLVTADPNGTIGVTVAGYNGSNQGLIRHYEVSESNGAQAVSGGSWPMFHHDPRLTGDAGGTPALGSVAPCTIPSGAYPGYDLVASDGGVFSFGQPFCGSAGDIALHSPVVGMAMAPNVGGYWLVASDGGIFAFGDAQYYGSMGTRPLYKPIVGMAAMPDGKGYWLVASDGGIFAFGDAQYYGSMGERPLKAPIVGITATADGQGYRLVASDGGVFAFGDAQYFGSMGDRKLYAPVTATADDIATAGYWLAGSDGGVFAFSPYYGSMGEIPVAAPMVGMEATDDGQGYRLVASDGGVFAFGDAQYFGSMGERPLAKPVVGIAGS